MFNDSRIPDRIWGRLAINASTSCWEWTSYVRPDGYCTVWWKKAGANVYVHRLLFTVLVRDPGNLFLDHLCRNRRCANPAHLEPVTPLENTRRGLHGSETHCPQGHAYDRENTYLTKAGSRNCRGCIRESGKQYRARLRNTRPRKADLRPKPEGN